MEPVRLPIYEEGIQNGSARLQTSSLTAVKGLFNACYRDVGRQPYGAMGMIPRGTKPESAFPRY